MFVLLFNYYVNTKEKTNHFTFIFFFFLAVKGANLCDHSNDDLLTCENMFLGESQPGISMVII